MQKITLKTNLKKINEKKDSKHYKNYEKKDFNTQMLKPSKKNRFKKI